MKLLFDLFPVILFFVAYKAAGVYVATGVAMAATVAQIAWLKLRGRTVETMQWASLALIVVFGGMTLAFQDETFIKWKPTVLYALFAIGLVAAPRLMGRNPLRALMGAQVSLPDAIWARLVWIWAAFFAAMAVLNIVVAYSVSLDRWVDFKTFGATGLTLAFVVGQALWLGRHAEDPGR